jgi:hypothetical protein
MQNWDYGGFLRLKDYGLGGFDLSAIAPLEISFAERPPKGKAPPRHEGKLQSCGEAEDRGVLFLRD